MDFTSILAFVPVYVVGFVSLYSIIAWGLIFESRRNLSEGFIKTFTTRILVGVGLMFMLAIWLLYVNVSKVKDLGVQILNYFFLIIMITFITWVAVSVNKLGHQFGFKVAVNNIMRYIERDKDKPLEQKDPPIQKRPRNNP